MLLLFFKEHPSHSALCCDISVELSPFAVKSMFGCDLDDLDQSHCRKLHIQVWLWPGLMNEKHRYWVHNQLTKFKVCSGQ